MIIFTKDDGEPHVGHPDSYPLYYDHIYDEDGMCWCEPDLEYEDPETGARLWVHKRTDN